MIERIPEYARTDAVARAVVSPSAILLAGAGAAVVVASGLPLLLAPLAAVAAWGARVAMAVGPKPSVERIDPFTVGDPWRREVQGALQAQARFARAVSSCRSGPLQERLAEITRQVDDGVKECWQIARQGDALDAAVAELDVAALRDELAGAVIEQRQASEARLPELDRTVEALKAQVASAERLQDTASTARDRLRRLGAQLDEAAARAVELSLQAREVGDLAGLGDDVGALVAGMEALRQALGEAGTATA